jgi:hypothetical protein
MQRDRWNDFDQLSNHAQICFSYVHFRSISTDDYSQCMQSSRHSIFQRANRFDRNTDFVAALQREIARWHNSGPCHEQTPVRKRAFAIKE